MEYVIVTITFRCPACDKSSVEQLVAETERFDRDQMARTLSRQQYYCQLCSKPLPKGTHGDAHAELATPSRLHAMGFPISRPN
jgi:hypothetical protein